MIFNPHPSAGVIQIHLAGGEVALIDSCDWPLVAPYRWWVGSGGYACTRINGAHTGMHRLLLQPAEENVVDHIDGDPLNNQRSNLRECSHAENMRNRKLNANSASGLKGVYRDNSKRAGPKKWRAEIKSHGRKIYLGNHFTPEEAHAAYRRAAIRLHGEFARFK